MLLYRLLEVSPPIDIWHDTVFQLIVIAAITLVAAIIGSLVSFWFSLKQRNRKEISYQVISDAPIASINKDVKDRVKILFDGNPVRDMSLLVLKVWNSGNTAVKPEDYVEPVKFEFEKRTVVSRDLLSTEPDDLIDPKSTNNFFSSTSELATSEVDTITLPKFLLNPKESISFKLLLTGSKSDVIGRARIADGNLVKYTGQKPKNSDVSEITELRFPRLLFPKEEFHLKISRLLLLFLAFILSFSFTLILFLIIFHQTENDSITIAFVISLTLCFVVVLIKTLPFEIKIRW